jgi:hypothetical protein
MGLTNPPTSQDRAKLPAQTAEFAVKKTQKRHFFSAYQDFLQYKLPILSKNLPFSPKNRVIAKNTYLPQ